MDARKLDLIIGICSRGLDPSQDSERLFPSRLPGASEVVAEVSIRRRILKVEFLGLDDRLVVHVAEVSIRRRILKDCLRYRKRLCQHCSRGLDPSQDSESSSHAALMVWGFLL